MVVITVQMIVTHPKLLYMKKLTTIFILLISITNFIACDSSDNNELEIEEAESIDTQLEWRCGTHNGNTLYTGPRGGCYYYNSNNNRTYVDRSECSC